MKILFIHRHTCSIVDGGETNPCIHMAVVVSIDDNLHQARAMPHPKIITFMGICCEYHHYCLPNSSYQPIIDKFVKILAGWKALLLSNHRKTCIGQVCSVCFVNLPTSYYILICPDGLKSTSRQAWEGGLFGSVCYVNLPTSCY